MTNPFSLEGKTILVTGASSGIGRSVGIECSKMGANVILTARNLERLSNTAYIIGSRLVNSIKADLTNDDDVSNLINELPELDGAVLCAGQGYSMPVKMSNRSKFNPIFDVNFFSPVELTRLLFSKKKLKSNSSLILIDSIGGLMVYSTGNAIYGTSKAALHSFMKYAANEYSSKKIRVNSISPGMVETPLIHHGGISDAQLKEYVSSHPLGRFGKPEDIAYAAIYLLSDASSWITGTNIVIDGGRTLR